MCAYDQYSLFISIDRFWLFEKAPIVIQKARL